MPLISIVVPTYREADNLPLLAAAIDDALTNDDADFVAGSRYVGGGGADKQWPLHRRLFSAAATIPAKMLVPMNDPMSGFFAFRRAQLPPNLTPIGYKIGLEIAAKMPKRRIVEVPIFFRDRQKGESKLNWRETLNYLRHLRRLFWHRWPKRTEVAQFCAAGGMGMVIDLLVYFTLQGLGLSHLFARALAFWPAVTFNWFVNRIMTFKMRPRPVRIKQWLQFCATSSIGFVCNWGSYAMLTSKVQFFADNLLLAFFIGVLVGTIFNFICADRIVFRR